MEFYASYLTLNSCLELMRPLCEIPLGSYTKRTQQKASLAKRPG